MQSNQIPQMMAYRMPPMFYSPNAAPDDSWKVPFYVSGCATLLLSLCGLAMTVLRVVMIIMDKEELNSYDVLYSLFGVTVFIWKICIETYALFNAGTPSNLTPMRGYFTVCMYGGSLIDLILILLVGITLAFMQKPDYKEIIIYALIILLVFLIISAGAFFVSLFALLKFVPEKTMGYPYMQILPRFNFEPQN